MCRYFIFCSDTVYCFQLMSTGDFRAMRCPLLHRNPHRNCEVTGKHVQLTDPRLIHKNRQLAAATTICWFSTKKESSSKLRNEMCASSIQWTVARAQWNNLLTVRFYLIYVYRRSSISALMAIFIYCLRKYQYCMQRWNPSGKNCTVWTTNQSLQYAYTGAICMHLIYIHLDVALCRKHGSGI